MTSIISDFNKIQIDKILSARDFVMPKFKPGDTLNVRYKIFEGSSFRIQSFVGIVIARSKSDSNYSATFTLRKVSSGIGVERKFPLYSPVIVSVEIVKSGDVRRAKLYYLRGLAGKASRIKEKLDFSKESQS